MNYEFCFSSEILCANVAISGNAPNAKIFRNVLIDTGASISWFPEEDLKKVGAVKGLYDKDLETANGSITLPVYEVKVVLGIDDDASQLRNTARVESKEIPVCAPKTDTSLIGRDILKRYKRIYLNWRDQKVVDVDLG